ncbi:unnamed protein product [Cylindrotheca closterium]|uniref:Uncharacterized protein n=1 Tax=Cylindrotheca closterium TaxID=2856 RepID=A0AAD2GD34_9STRA|nr:unnamed protein product [Cylindrotheca closterium]
MLVASLLFYKKIRADLKGVGFNFNPYNPCVANHDVYEKQQTIRFHVDDLLSSHAMPKVNDEFLVWLNETYRSYKECISTCDNVHVYLGMTLDFSKKGKLKICMDDYVKRMLDEFPVKFGESDHQETPAGNTLLDFGNRQKLDTARQEVFHSFVAKGLFLSKRARLNILHTILILASQVREPNESDWKKIVCLMRYLHSTQG